MNILLTGVTGFVGKRLTMRLLQEGHAVYAIVRNEEKANHLIDSVPKHIREKLYLFMGDIGEPRAGLDDEKVLELKGKIDTVYHMAAYLSFNDGEKERTYHVNVEGTRHLLELAKEIEVDNFSHVSTAYTLGNQVHATEELHSMEQSFVNEYEKSKCQAEHLVYTYRDRFNVNIYRPSIIVGDSKTGEAETTFALYGVMRSFEILQKRMERQKDTPLKKVKFLCNSDTAQNLVPVDYVVDVLVLGLNHAKRNEIYHITNSHPPTNQMVFDTLKNNLRFNQVELVPTSFEGELTEQEAKFNQPMKVFHQYLNRTLTFDDSNTQQLLKESNKLPLDFNEEVLDTIISGR
ncbi:SDR family NAD(P)-dependent oxidoreductase [Halobacillus litoralis]|uniref:Short-chain dehydrogenase n=1 Tax=Halobacillus litoralis TaxID=45668 RepID=A0A410MAZ7_9BACI|nr:SDR family NAD(P)-dependent oxidoreductase [Halobacillus litoralis]QAS51887.1 short-chain dehydrogenase [Halobacillus litoralis]